MYKELDKNKSAVLSCPRYLAIVIYEIRLNSWNTKHSQKVTCICTNPISVYHILLKCLITTALFKKYGYDVTACNTVIDILYNTDVITHIAKLNVYTPVGKLI